jgi:hypothetical protein
MDESPEEVGSPTTGELPSVEASTESLDSQASQQVGLDIPGEFAIKVVGILDLRKKRRGIASSEVPEEDPGGQSP